MAATCIANHHNVGLGLFDREHNLLRGECLVGISGGKIRDSLYLAHIDIYVRGLDSDYVMGFDLGGVENLTQRRRPSSYAAGTRGNALW